MHHWVHVEHREIALTVQTYAEFEWIVIDELDAVGICNHCKYAIDDYIEVVNQHVSSCEQMPSRIKQKYDNRGFLTPFKGHYGVSIDLKKPSQKKNQ